MTARHRSSRSSMTFARLIRIMTIAISGVAFAASALAQAGPARNAIDGDWEFTIEMPDQRVTMLAELSSSKDGQVTLTALGPTDGKEGKFTGLLAGGKLVLKVSLPSGVMDIAMSLDGDRLSGTWVSGTRSGNIVAQRVKELKEGVSFSSLAEVVWKFVDDGLFDPQFNGVDWNEIKLRYLPHAKAARTNSEIVSVIRGMLGELKVSHLDFFIAPDKPPVTNGLENITWRRLSPRNGLLKIRDFDAEDAPERSAFMSSLDNALSEMKDLPGLIVDLRGNRGGSVDPTLQALDCFLSDRNVVLYAANRAGLANHHVKSLDQLDFSTLPQARISEGSVAEAVLRQGAIAITAGGNGRKVYEGKLAVLIDERCVSGCEIFAAVLKESRRATLIGRRTGGEVLGADTIVFSKNMVIAKPPTRWRLRLPIIDFRTAGRRRLEGRGVEPDIAVSEEISKDADLSRAIELLTNARRQ